MSADYLLDEVKKALSLKTDAELSKRLESSPVVISKVRHGMPLGPTLIVSIHEETGWATKKIKAIANAKGVSDFPGINIDLVHQKSPH